ncbi:MAG TPA: DUF2497 domain-containing protein [Pedomonas sp.]|uniref:DUF2497 domain-containing protein n=1 Tax=Pedomonas sp. TaxID=2976421 RepID=UPI002F3F640F
MAESKEPTMEEILASIRRIISEEGEAVPEPAKPEPAKAAEPAPAPKPEPVSQQSIDDIFEDIGEEDEDVLELTESVEAPASVAYQPEVPPMTESLVSEQTVAATTQTLHSLSGLLVRNYPGSENTLEGVVREMLRPMLKEWLDANLPEIVERTVAREVARITGRVAGE